MTIPSVFSSKVFKKLIIIILVLVLLVFLFLMVANRDYFNKESRLIPSDWKSYTNSFYNYSLQYEPDLFVEGYIYGSNDGEDIRITIHKFNEEDLKARGVLKSFKSDLSERGILLGEKNDLWQILFDKPEIIDSWHKPCLFCLVKKTNSGTKYLRTKIDNNTEKIIFFTKTQHNKDQTIIIPATIKYVAAKKGTDTLEIDRIINSFNIPQTISIEPYPSIDKIASYMKVYNCNNMPPIHYIKCENGFIQLQNYRIFNAYGLLSSLDLQTPYSACSTPLSETPYLTSPTCPYPNDKSLASDVNLLGTCDNLDFCINSYTDLEATSVNNIESISKILSDALTAYSPEVKAGWVPIIFPYMNAAFAFPSQWKVIGNSASNPQTGTEINIESQLESKIFEPDELSSNDEVIIENFACGNYAKCSFVRKLINNNEYEYELYRADNSGIFYSPPLIRARMGSVSDPDLELNEVDRIVRSMIVIYPSIDESN